MKEKTFISRSDDKKKLTISQKNEWDAFLHPHKRYLHTLREYDPGSSQGLRGYYFNKVVPEFRKALYLQGSHKTKSETDQFIRENVSPITIEETWNGKWEKRVKTISELSNSELNILIFEAKIYAAEHLFVYIHDPRTV